MSESEVHDPPDAAARVADEIRRIQAEFGKVLAGSVTSRCNLRCRHCGRSCVAEGDDLPDELIASIGAGLPSVSRGIREFGITGGEPMLCRDRVRSLSDMAADCGITACVMTNAYWATSVSIAKQVLRSFAGLQAIGVSTDRYHLPFVPLTHIRNACEAAREIGLGVRVSITAAVPHDIEDERLIADVREFAGDDLLVQELAPRGRARSLKETPPTSSELPLLPCTSLGPLIREDGVVAPCCRGLDWLPHGHVMSVGDLREASLPELYRRLQSHAVLQFVRVWGFSSLFERMRSAGLAGFFPGGHLQLSPCATCSALCRIPELCGFFETLMADSWFRLQVASGRHLVLDESEMLDLLLPSSIQ